MGITNIEYKKKLFSFKNEIYISLSRPGILIGKKGECINFLNNQLSEYFKKKVTIYLIEDPLFSHLTFFEYREAGDE